MARSKFVNGGTDATIAISTGTVLKTIGVILLAVLVYFVREVVVIFLLALLLAALIDPFADKLAQFKIPRGIAVITVYTFLIAILTGLFFLVAPPLREQTSQIFDRYGSYLVEISGNNQVLVSIFSGNFFELDFQDVMESIRSAGLTGSISELLTFASDTFGIVLGILVVLVLAFYLVVEDKKLREGIEYLAPERHRKFVRDVFPVARKKTGEWLRGQLVIMISVFVVMFVILEFVLDLPFALVLALVAALLEIIPFIGPILASVPAILVALAVSPIHAVFTMLAYLGVQQLEGHVLAPKIMQRVTGISPVISILSVLVGFELLGPAGAILAIPTSVVAGVVWFEWVKYNQKQT